MGIDERLKTLERKPEYRDMPEIFGRIWDALKEVDDCVGLAPDETEESRMAKHIKDHGTKEEFISKKMYQWNRQHGRE